MTEEEARAKMCCGPQVVALAIVASAPPGRAELDEGAGRCIASDCMAWRQIVEKQSVPPGEFGGVHKYRREVVGGYCGLAGAPLND